MDRNFKDKVVVVTGAGQGQGRNHAIEFAKSGARLAICDIARQLPVASPMASESDLEETAAQIRDLGQPCVSIVGDSRSSTDMQALIDAAVSEYGRVDILLANAGIAAFGPIAEMPDDMWHEVVDINLSGVATSIRAAIPTMISQRSGRIVATASSVGREGGPNNANYAASKWGVIGFIKSVAIELAPLGITVNAFSPMSVSTAMCHNEKTYTLFRPDLSDPTTEDVRDTFAGLNPMGVPWLELSDATAAVMYLASDDARYITGAALDIAGGWNARHVA